MPEIIDIKKGLRAAAAVIKNGGIVAFPTETFYGLAADIYNQEAINRIFKIKGRKESNPLPLIADSIHTFKTAVSDIHDEYMKIASYGWPDAFTVICPARSDLPEGISMGGKVAVRVSSNCAARSLSRLTKRCITSTSANITGMPPASNAKMAAIEGVDIVLDGGESPGGRPSTIAEFSDGRWKILREGNLIPNQIGELKIPSGYEWFSIPGCLGGLYQPSQGYRFTTDSVILAAYALEEMKGTEKTILDAGCDTGVLSLILTEKYPVERIFSVDINCSSIEALKATVQKRKAGVVIEPVCGDLSESQEFLPGECCDMVISNPPFYRSDGRSSPDEKRRMAMTEGTGSAVIFMRAASRVLKPSGAMYMIIPPERLGSVLAECASVRLNPENIKPVYNELHGKAKRMLLTLRKGGKKPLECSSPVIIREDGDYSNYMKTIT
ncbi:MAG: threonylcarbamoyl-AMP synthase [Deltaproteobacteria bacterium]|nr:threonylcarbamoyl-AMP synthase [Deltaproteobacteria bacterium]